MQTDANNVNDHDQEPCEQREYLHLLGMLNYIAHSCPDIFTALSYATTKNTNPTKGDFEELLLVVDYLCQTKKKDQYYILLKRKTHLSILYVMWMPRIWLIQMQRVIRDISYLFGRFGSFCSKSSKQKLIATSSTHAEI